MMQSVKSKKRTSKGDRLNWTSISELKEITIKKLDVKGAKVFSSKMNETRINGNCNSNLLVP
ncbi:hypothetical protein ORI89_17460 [Sphingobacterium sp. UT-1RO-CII-1]|uniref:hypothetical protein n=1 Tax=Sphingobacterium sp. UT-1RO-CII-1 TaxID=2995225 RepID=UPI00227B5EC1|nr:hypothetical protein [Sphingobacterium sp. UT-1RO-CII-1]MCY4781451.1 hypothetical protein [Sphingobacterium sp. UT-1RO-CII-1]